MCTLKHAQKKVDQLDIDRIGDEFIRGGEHPICQFGKFTLTSIYM